MNPNLKLLVQVIINMSGESYNGECLQLSIKHSGSLGLHFSQLCWDPVKIYGIANLEKYNCILIHHVVPSGMFLIDNGLILLHDNDPNAVKACLDRKTQSSLPRPQHR